MLDIDAAGASHLSPLGGGAGQLTGSSPLPISCYHQCGLTDQVVNINYRQPSPAQPSQPSPTPAGLTLPGRGGRAGTAGGPWRTADTAGCQSGVGRGDTHTLYTADTVNEHPVYT